MNKFRWLILLLMALGIIAFFLFQAKWHQPAETEVRKEPPPDARTTPTPPEILPVAQPKPRPEPRVSMVPLRQLNASMPVAVILGLVDGQKDYNARALALRQLTRTLNTNDVQALRLFLDLRAREQSEMNERQFNGIKNEVLDVLVRQDQMPENLGLDMVRMYRDTMNDNMWRDYCLQYMTTYWNRMQPLQANTNWAAERPEIESIGVKSKHSTIGLKMVL